FSIASKSKPACSANLWSSAATTATRRCGETSELQSYSTGAPRATEASIMKALAGGGTNEKSATAITTRAEMPSSARTKREKRRRTGLGPFTAKARRQSAANRPAGAGVGSCGVVEDAA